MKKTKRIISALLTVLMLSLTLIMPVNAATELPESKHDYENNSYEYWYYEHPKNVDGLYITFSDETSINDGEYFCNNHPDGCPWGYFDEETLDDDYCQDEDYFSDPCDDESKFYTGEDILVITCDEYYDLGFTGEELKGRTIYIPYSSFVIQLFSGSQATDYGFKITRIASTLPKNETAYRYNFGNGEEFIEVAYGETYLNDELENYIVDGEAIVGWETKDSEEFYFFDENTLPDKKGMIDLYPITTPVALLPEDVYSFINSSYYMLVNGEDRIYFTDEHKARLHESITLASKGTYLSLLGSIMNLVFKNYDQWEFPGACIGFANTVCLQKKGIIDVVSTQGGAECVRDLVPDTELISYINYYNAHSATTLLPKNKGLFPGTKEYTRQVKRLVESVREGNLVLFEFYPTDVENPINDYHGIVFTGTYTLPDGRHVLLYYDENSYDYSLGFAGSITVAADYSTIHGHYENAIFFWEDEFEYYKTIDINGDYDDGTNYYKDGLEAHIAETVEFYLEEYIKPFLAKLFGSTEE